MIEIFINEDLDQRRNRLMKIFMEIFINEDIDQLRHRLMKILIA